MAPKDLSSRARDLPFDRLDLKDSVVRLQDLQLLPGTADTSAIVAALQADLVPDRTTRAAAAGAGQAGGNAAAGAHAAGQRVVDQLKNSQDFVVGLANSEVGKIAAQAIAAQSGGISSVGVCSTPPRRLAPSPAPLPVDRAQPMPQRTAGSRTWSRQLSRYRCPEGSPRAGNPRDSADTVKCAVRAAFP